MTTLDYILQRSNEFDEVMLNLLEHATYDNSNRSQATFTMCCISLEHANSLRLLIASGNLTSAVALMRLQFEALARAMWLLYAASDPAVVKLQAPLTSESEKIASNQPSIKEMLNQIDQKGPSAASQMLAQFKDVSWSAMNSFVHGASMP